MKPPSERVNVVRLVKLPKLGGRVPLSEDDHSCSECNDDKLPMDGGIVPYTPFIEACNPVVECTHSVVIWSTQFVRESPEHATLF